MYIYIYMNIFFNTKQQSDPDCDNLILIFDASIPGIPRPPAAADSSWHIRRRPGKVATEELGKVVMRC